MKFYSYYVMKVKFPIKKVTPSIIKYCHGYNHYSVRNLVINNKMVGSECSRYSKVET